MAIERWKSIGRTLGEGGQGQVIVVKDKTGVLPGEFALKILKNKNRASRLDLEISTMRSLNRTGSHVVRIVEDYTESDPDADRPWYVMEIANGGSLAKAIKPGQCFGGDEIKALTVFRNIVNAVKGLHTNGIAHRDLKPENILIHNDAILLCDLGLCLPLYENLPEERLTGELERIGSVHYMPKEAFGPNPLNRSQFSLDAYALGKVLYELLAGMVLPGFSQPNEPQFDLYLKSPTPFYSGVNFLLRGLLNDSPDRRLVALDSIEPQIDSLVALLERSAGGKSDDLVKDLFIASEALARVLVINQNLDNNEEQKRKCAEFAKEVMNSWAESNLLKAVESTLIAGNANALEIQRHQSSPQFRQLISGPFINSHNALEPIEDRGYPKRPKAESGCTIGIIPKGRLAAVFPQLYLGFLIALDDSNLVAAFAVAKREPGEGAYVDVVPGSEFIFASAEDSIEMLNWSLDTADSSLRKLVACIKSDYKS